MAERVRICDIAEKLGLSTATVSNVIHGKTGKVSAETAEHVTALLEEREYIPSMAGIRVPEDISVAGFDNFIHPGICNVEITSYEVDIKEMARKAINTLIKKMNGESYKQGITVVDGHMVVKSSVKRI